MGRLELLLALFGGLTKGGLAVKAFDSGAYYGGVEALDGEPVCLFACLWGGVVDPVMIEGLCLSKSVILWG